MQEEVRHHRRVRRLQLVDARLQLIVGRHRAENLLAVHRDARERARAAAAIGLHRDALARRRLDREANLGEVRESAQSLDARILRQRDHFGDRRARHAIVGHQKGELVHGHVLEPARAQKAARPDGACGVRSSRGVR